MKKIFVIIVIAFFLVFSWGCCTKKDCENPISHLYFTLYDYTEDDLNVIIIKRYIKGTDFGVVKDSIIDSGFKISIDSNLYEFRNTKSLPITFEYRIFIKSTNQLFEISNYEFNQISKCNQCFFRKSEYTVEFKSLLFNNVYQTSTFIHLQK